jgi:hypothetical protein
LAPFAGCPHLLKDETAKKVMSVPPNRQALEELLAFCQNALRD